MKLPTRITAAIATAALVSSLSAAVPPPPGVVIHHVPASEKLYIGSPSLCVLPDGTYLASHDLFGPGSQEHKLATGRLYRSADKGKTWSHLRDFNGFFWQGLFVHRGAAYALGTDKHHGRMVIRRSTDGRTWTDPTTPGNGVLAEGEWHTAPMPVIEHEGRVWRAIEDAMGGTKWGERYRARMMSAPMDADLLDAANWTFSNPLPRDPSWLDGDFAAWLEGNAVVDPQGGIVDVLRVDNSRVPEKAAIVRISKDGKTTSFDPAKDFTDFNGGAKKFTIRKDPRGGGYWALASIIPERHQDPSLGRPGGIRNTLALVHSVDLRTWERRSILLYHPDLAKHGFQYVDWQYDGDDMIAACRTAWDDEEGGAHNNHDANFFTFHRWKNFRDLTRKDDVPMPEPAMVSHETVGLSIKGSDFEIGILKDGEKAFGNRSYKWREIPPPLAGMSFTRIGGGTKAVLKVAAKADTELRIATSESRALPDLRGWTRDTAGFHYDDAGNSPMEVFTRQIKKGETLVLPRGSWTGSILIFPADP